MTSPCGAADIKRSVPILNHFFISVPEAFRRFDVIAVYKSQTLWLVGSMLAESCRSSFTAERNLVAPTFSSTFAILQCAFRVAKRITLPMDLALYLRRSEADSSIFSLQKSDHYHELKKLEAENG